MAAQESENDDGDLGISFVLKFSKKPPRSRDRKKFTKVENYEKSLRELGTFSSIQDFWGIYTHIVRLEDLHYACDFHLFKQGIRPVWEVCRMFVLLEHADLLLHLTSGCLEPARR